MQPQEKNRLAEQHYIMHLDPGRMATIPSWAGLGLTSIELVAICCRIQASKTAPVLQATRKNAAIPLPMFLFSCKMFAMFYNQPESNMQVWRFGNSRAENLNLHPSKAGLEILGFSFAKSNARMRRSCTQSISDEALNHLGLFIPGRTAENITT